MSSDAGFKALNLLGGMFPGISRVDNKSANGDVNDVVTKSAD